MVKGWFGDKLRHRLASRGILTTFENRGEGYYIGELTLNEKRWLGEQTQEAVIKMMQNNTDYKIVDVTHSMKGLGDILVEVQTDCGECVSLVEIKNVEALHKTDVGKIAINVKGHMALMENARELGAIPVYIIKVNDDLGNGIFESEYYWKRAEDFDDDVRRMKGTWFTQVIHKALDGAKPINESFDFIENECNRRICDD